ncbi:conserved hypothetical protein [Aspergillus udagawae]|uniref:Uncharacterized protein n=1 Tax=Aspergillus udagawae TaxID=91492 RepID=A0ABQ1BBS3_9EURO|nr:conserved hypothetical protein [Aspergillus udagawae]
MSVELVFGGGSIVDGTRYNIEEVHKELDILGEGGVKVIDTAALCTKCEELLGQVKAAPRFTMDSKYPGQFAPNQSPANDIIATAESSLQKLQTYQIWKFLELGKAGSFIQNSPVRMQLRFQFLIHRWRV